MTDLHRLMAPLAIADARARLARASIELLRQAQGNPLRSLLAPLVIRQAEASLASAALELCRGNAG